MNLHTFYGGCGVEKCLDCRPIFDADNEPIPGTDTDQKTNAELFGIAARHINKKFGKGKL